MFNLLNPGGSALITDFMPNNLDRGYMETFMGWKLIYRDENEIVKLSQKLPLSQVEYKRIFTNEERIIGYLEIKKDKGRACYFLSCASDTEATY